jgi:hypothetical protein
MSEPIYFFFHIPKTGGDTVRKHFWRSLRKANRVSADMRDDPNAKLRAMTPQQRDAYQIVMGHGVTAGLARYFEGREARFFTVLREPVGHVVSTYNWYAYRVKRDEGREPAPFDEWFTPAKYSIHARWLLTRFDGRSGEGYGRECPQHKLLADSLEVLERFWLVATLEQLDRTLAPAFQALKVPPKIQRSTKIAGQDLPKILARTPEIEARVRECSSADVRLYERYAALVPA